MANSKSNLRSRNARGDKGSKREPGLRPRETHTGGSGGSAGTHEARRKRDRRHKYPGPGQ